MPQILVVTDSTEDSSEVVYRERISATDLESSHFSGQLVERVGWAVRDANELERRSAHVVALAPPRLTRGRAGAGGLRPSA
ncbi:MAG: hypothetical protein QOE56_499 [Solirubrobacterales bacterium]|jgi:hypothetical protein|nr:hypothetical protein [Solirubrobacterales bacterium]